MHSPPDEDEARAGHAFMRRHLAVQGGATPTLDVLRLAVRTPPQLEVLLEPLTDQYVSVPTSAEQDGTPSVLASAGVRCEVVRRMEGPLLRGHRRSKRRPRQPSASSMRANGS